MAVKDLVRDLQDFDINDLDFENVGSWPLLVKIISWVLVFVVVLAAGYFYVIADQRVALQREQNKEQELRADFKTKALKAANLAALRQQMAEMEETFGALVSQLPSDTEVPGLLEDITNKGVESGLEIISINLQREQVKEFYVELPIQISVKGGYHDLGAFVSGISGLPRIVTLHDFKISDGGAAGVLSMNITARTYRYKDANDA
ncbi:MAG TPA: type 4a pilus biogenesis protein PilO [Spongiibacteraceae bacterium]|nr:type 4a pilus biogenesis protein PilO [Spongiibacteraceae bacterium]HUH37762.1 type 4a pilus biogenesis protein PilO [Spongiibacteraceae bacterium]